ncbi:uncharacterized protein LAJ45_06461 [Morchella importuna]|uniref:Rhamnolipids biosynthesis 3-oxoacyl-reductase n=1 Tax=Morchella conica CCBAS932 TaxID=1392247 RepID=A0A3N4L2S8_9PEZI|nr:uncharacterized protein LAJ45_06461 [Morchella importuna]KAH8149382.1 hypothetical protein LAJ45_06461 [Morchella importuna]RPB17164.1 rhamnolipids biosynthesis 3-oxoacyl-reductase [Morchella conica CCBAS932]
MDIPTLFSVRNKTVLITGGGKGIGLMISRGFIANGAKVYITSRDATALSTACDELNAMGPGTAHAIPADLYKLSDCEALVKELEKREERLHVLVNNSGSNWGEGYDSYPESAWDRVLTLNLKRVFTVTQMCTPLLERGAVKGVGEGVGDPARIINIGSVDGIAVPALETFAYSASKAGLHHLSEVLAHHLGKRNITVNTLACGPFESKMMAATLKKMRSHIEASIPLGRIGTPEDVAGCCLFLASRAGAYVNGATITVDGGGVVSPKL